MKRREFLKKTSIAASLGFAWSGKVVVYYDRQNPKLQFAADEISSALAKLGGSVAKRDRSQFGRASEATRIVLLANPATGAKLGFTASEGSTPECYSIRKQTVGSNTSVVVVGADAVGAMYGGLDIAEAIRIGTFAQLKDEDHAPHIARRGIKFNIPLDVRTPSYSDCSDAAQQNLPEMWSFDFWREQLDEMARNRYNVLSLWNLHPFPSMVRVPEYPDVALSDVQRTTIKLPDTFSFEGKDMVRPEMLENVEIIKKMSIDQKIDFWRRVMQYADDRGIEVYLITWNIFVWGAQGKYGITSAQDNLTTIDYIRKSVREAILTYPLLAGIGVTAGENMVDRKDDFSKEKWLWKAYGEGVLDAKKVQPDRHIRLIHRYHESALDPIQNAFSEYRDTFDLSYKYSVAHMYSTPKPIFAKECLDQLPSKLRMWMTVRNDDIYSFRWGDPDYARDYIRNLPGPDKLAGFYMGPDGYIWGREFISTEPESPPELVFKKQWYSFLLWGRLSYNPDLTNEFFQSLLAQRLPGVPSEALFSASSSASKIIPQITRFFWQDIDLKWFPEACLSHPRWRGFYTVKHFMEGVSMPGTGTLNIRDYRKQILSQQPSAGITPLQVSANLNRYAEDALKITAQLRAGKNVSINKELRLTLGDIDAMSHLGRYYAAKILGATELSFYDASGDAGRQKTAIQHLEEADRHWSEYAAIASRQYKPQLLNRVGRVDLTALRSKVLGDVATARNWKPSLVKT